MGASIRVTLTPNALALLGYDPKQDCCSSAPLEIREDLLESLFGNGRSASPAAAPVPLPPVAAPVPAIAAAPILHPLPASLHPLPASLHPMPGVVAETQPGCMPCGLHDEGVLQRLTESAVKISGLVVSVARASDSGSAGSRLIRQVIEDFLSPEDFACNIGAEEFLLHFPNLRGAEAQRRLRLIAQRLWDLQLDMLHSGATPIAWGAIEVDQEAVGEAFAAASERMRETSRTRHGFLENAALPASA